MTLTTYVRYEILRVVRNRRYLIFTLGFPVVLYVSVASGNRHVLLAGIPFVLYFMIGMATWGSMSAVLATGSRISADRARGWNRQLRITPLGERSYLATKVILAYLLALLEMLILFALGLSVGVHLGLQKWLEMTGLILIGLVPIVLIGIALGHLLRSETTGPAAGGLGALLALLGGSFGDITAGSRTFAEATKLLPSYWLEAAGRVTLGGLPWTAEGWLVVAAWTLGAFALARWAFLRDTAKV
jgi:ABC-2 type transport system permease protein